MQITLGIPDSVLSDLTAIARAEGFGSVKDLMAHWLTEKVRVFRLERAEAAAKKTVNIADVVIA